MRRGISLFVACVVVALVACASEDLPVEKVAGSPSPGGDVTGSWTATWAPLVGTNTYPDTLKNSLNQDSIVTRTVRDTCTGTVGQSLETYDWRWFARAPLNNAVVIAQRLYRMNLNLFEEVYVHSNADLRETIRAIQVRVFTQPGDPYQALYSRGG